MIKTLLSTLLILPYFVSSTAIAIENSEQTPAGLWRTIDDVTGKPRSIVRIEKSENGYFGVIEKGFPRPGEPEHKFCEKCSGDKKDKPIIGMQFLWGLKGSNNSFDGGEVLDPDNGKIYRCKITLSNNNKSLTVRGYIGISLFGRSQTWERINSIDAN
jgi:uncharacterized protein (DUF2147 family)